jgi:transposase-like protein
MTMAQTIDDRLWTVEEVAARYGIAAGTLRNWRYLGIGPRSIKVGRRPLYPESELARWERAGMVAARRTAR